MRLLRTLSLFVASSGISTASTATAQDSTIRFVAFGDAGEIGTGLSLTSESVKRMIRSKETDFIAMVGDNFYPSGIHSPTDEIVSRVFLDHFGDIDVPFHPVLGDNDYGDDGIVGNLLAQVDLTDHIPNWQMPSLFYSRIIKKGNVSLCAVFIDTQSLLIVPDADKRSQEELSLLESQLDWIEQTLASDECQSSTFLVVFGHHPIKSTGKKHKKGKGKAVIAKLSPLFDLYKIDAYVCGHDHDLQFLYPYEEGPVSDEEDEPDIPAADSAGGPPNDPLTVFLGTRSYVDSSSSDTSSSTQSSTVTSSETPSISSTHSVSYIVSGAASRLRKNPLHVGVPLYNTWSIKDMFGYAIFESRLESDIPVLVTLFIRSETDEVVHSHPIRSHVDLRLATPIPSPLISPIGSPPGESLEAFDRADGAPVDDPATST